MELVLYALAHAALGAGLGAALYVLNRSMDKDKFSLVHALLVAGSLVCIFVFADYVGMHVRQRTFSSLVEAVSVTALIVCFVAGWLVARQLRLGDRS